MTPHETFDTCMGAFADALQANFAATGETALSLDDETDELFAPPETKQHSKTRWTTPSA